MVVVHGTQAGGWTESCKPCAYLSKTLNGCQPTVLSQGKGNEVQSICKGTHGVLLHPWDLHSQAVSADIDDGGFPFCMQTRHSWLMPCCQGCSGLQGSCSGSTPGRQPPQPLMSRRSQLRPHRTRCRCPSPACITLSESACPGRSQPKQRLLREQLPSGVGLQDAPKVSVASA